VEYENQQLNNPQNSRVEEEIGFLQFFAYIYSPFFLNVYPNESDGTDSPKIFSDFSLLYCKILQGEAGL